MTELKPEMKFSSAGLLRRIYDVRCIDAGSRNDDYPVACGIDESGNRSNPCGRTRCAAGR
jgi:hypothetical protein